MAAVQQQQLTNGAEGRVQGETSQQRKEKNKTRRNNGIKVAWKVLSGKWEELECVWKRERQRERERERRRYKRTYRRVNRLGE